MSKIERALSKFESSHPRVKILPIRDQEDQWLDGGDSGFLDGGTGLQRGYNGHMDSG